MKILPKGLENHFLMFYNTAPRTLGFIILNNFQKGLCSLGNHSFLDEWLASHRLLQIFCQFLGNGRFWKVDHVPLVVGMI